MKKSVTIPVPAGTLHNFVAHLNEIDAAYLRLYRAPRAQNPIREVALAFSDIFFAGLRFNLEGLKSFFR